MTDSTRFIGPRGWAVLVLASGATLSAPFLRKPSDIPPSTGSARQAPQDVDFSNTTWPDVREKSLTPSSQTASSLSEQDWAELARLQSNSGARPRKVTGELPSTSGSPLPSWADRGQRIDQLVNESIRTEPLASAAPLASTGLDPLRPWMGHGMKPIAETQPARPQLNDLPGDFALASPNPSARWNSVPSATFNSNAVPQDSGVLASGQPFRKFEDHVQQWPDEKLSSVPSPSQVAWDGPRAPQADHTAGPKPNWPGASPSTGFPVAGPTRSSSLTEPAPAAEPTEQLDTVSAPMISSQSGRLAPRLSSPIREAPKPSTNSPGPKQFIQQPTKRA